MIWITTTKNSYFQKTVEKNLLTWKFKNLRERERERETDGKRSKKYKQAESHSRIINYLTIKHKFTSN